MSGKARVAVLVSGAGTNLQALLDACAHADYPAEIVLVISNVPGVQALDRARRAGVEALELPHQAFASRNDFDHALAERLQAARVDWICLAGFMRLIGPELLRPFAGRILNIHPALLPAFPGTNAPRQALAYGVKVTGCTVHFVDEGTDTGPILGQAAVPVRDDDDEGTLAARIHQEEHRLYPQALRWVAAGRVQIGGRRVRVV